MTTEITFADVLSYVATRATEAEIRQLGTAANAAIKALRAQTAAVVSAQLEPGTRIKLTGVRPQYLNGLTGTFVRMNDGRGKQRAIIQLDDESRRWARNYAPDGKLAGVPVSALKIL